MKVKILFLALLVLVPVGGFALNLEQTISEVLNSNPVVQERIKYFRSVKQDVGIAESRYYPTIDVVGGIGRERTKNNNTGNEEVYLDRQEVGVVLTQNLFEGFGTQNDVKRQHARVDSAAFSVVEQADQTSLQMVEAYTELFKQKQLLILAEKNVQTHKEINGKIKDRIDSGVGANSEEEQSSSRLALAQSNLIVQMNNYEDALSSFTRVYGKDVVFEDLEEPNTLDGIPEEKSVILDKAATNNPSLKVQQANIKVARQNHSLSKKEFLPVIDLVLRQDWNEDVGGIDSEDDSASAMLQFRYNIYNGNADTSARQKSISELHKEMQVHEDLKRRLKESVRLAWMAYTSLEKQMEYLKEHKSLSQNTLDSYLEEFDLGRRTLLDILDTEEELYSANRELAIAKYDYIFAQYRIVEAMGSLTSRIDLDFLNVVGLGEDSKSKADMLDTLPQTKM